MRHGKKDNHLGRTVTHRKALLSNLASALILNKRIRTTLAKAKALRKYVEPLVTKSKNNTQHARRVVFSYLGNKNAVSELFREVGPKVAERPGGYTRIIKLENRVGDNAAMAFIELVDFNTLYTKDTKSRTKRRTRRSKAKKAVESVRPEEAINPTPGTSSEKSPEATGPETPSEPPQAEQESSQPS
ncbi:MAG: 50S ribosomal protein L17 [Flavobacteriales bacterium]|nr:50S ribosomal protein L17 [Flavobacteriales bacterium]